MPPRNSISLRTGLSFTDLEADVQGTITARSAESGQVVQPGQPIFTIARQDGRDAVFDVPAQVLARRAAGRHRHRRRSPTTRRSRRRPACGPSRAAGRPGNPHIPVAGRS